MKMILLWIPLLLLHQGYALVPVISVERGESVTITCSYPDLQSTNARIKWYKQSVSDSLQLMLSMMKGIQTATFTAGFPSSRFHANQSYAKCTLTILSAAAEDEALYHCGLTTWNRDEWSSTYLSVKGNIEKTTVVQWPTGDNPLHPGDSVTLQCYVHSDSESCPGGLGVHWFGVRSDKSQTNVIYTDGHKHDGCDENPDSPQKRCVYHLSKNVSSSDGGTYYCAVAACGKITFGGGTKLVIKETGFGFNLKQVANSLPFMCLVLAVTVVAFLIYVIRNMCKCCYCSNKAAVSLHEKTKRNLKRDGDKWIYSAVVFTMVTSDGAQKRGPKAMDRERIYAAVEAFGLD